MHKNPSQIEQAKNIIKGGNTMDEKALEILRKLSLVDLSDLLDKINPETNPEFFDLIKHCLELDMTPEGIERRRTKGEDLSWYQP